YSVAVVDLNGDGKPDLAAANIAYNDVSVLLGIGDGTFQAAQNFGAHHNSVFVAVGDLNGDGKPDLAVANSNSNDVSVLINNTTLVPNTLTVSKAGTGSGTVTSSDGAINCGSTCLAAYVSGTIVTLTASPSAGSVFSGWSGAGCSGTGTCVVTMTAAQAVSATFTQVYVYALTVTKTGSGSGTLTSSPAGIDCGATCSASFASGTSVTLTAAPASGSAFTGWSGAGCSGAGTCVVTMSAAQSVTASFSPN